VCAANLVVYVVEDDASVRRAVTRLLRAHGLQTVAFASAEAFLQAGSRASEACLLLDVQMPGMTGWELLTALQAAGRTLPVIIITAHTEEAPPERARQAGIVAYLRKPFDELALLEALQRVNARGSRGHREPGRPGDYPRRRAGKGEPAQCETCHRESNRGEGIVPLAKRVGAEFIGTFWLVLGGCGSAVLAAAFPQVGIGLHGVSLAFGLTVLTMAYAIGHISGCHLNPAVSVGLVVGGRFKAAELPHYIIAQVLGAIVAALVLYIIASGKAGFDLSGGLAANGYGAHSPGGYSLFAGLVTEVVMTGMFLLIILGATDERAPVGLAPVAIGLGLTLIHLISIPVTNTSVNPARSTGPALIVGGWALAQLWLFWVAPLIGAVIGGLAYSWLGAKEGSMLYAPASPPKTA
jgi:aquaporin Z